MGRVSRCIAAPVLGQTGLFIVFLLKGQQQKLGDRISGKLHIEQTNRGRNMVHVLPKAAIDIGRHRFVEVLTFDRLYRVYDLCTAKPKSGGTL